MPFNINNDMAVQSVSFGKADLDLARKRPNAMKEMPIVISNTRCVRRENR